MKSKKILISALTVVINLSMITAQVGIGTTTPDPSSILHLNSTSKGLLLTSIALTSATDSNTISSPAVGLLIWNNGLGGFTPAGLYYWNDNKWNSLSAGNSLGWNTTLGNAGNNAGSNTAMFIGTSTQDDLYFKVKSNTMGHLGINDGVNFGRSSNSGQYAVAIGYNTNALSNGSTAIATNSSANGDRSMAIGYNAKSQSNESSAFGVNSITQGDRSMVLGYNAKTQSNDSSAFGVNSTTNGDRSMALGYNAKTQANDTSAFGIGSYAEGDRSMALGYNAKTQAHDTSAFGINANAQGVRSMALGFNAKTQSDDSSAFGINSEASGIQSIALGFNAKAATQGSSALGASTNAGGQNSTVIGFGATTTQNNAVVIGNLSANIGIGTSTPDKNAKLDVNGQYKLGEKGSLHKNMISFETTSSITVSNLGAGQTTTFNIPIPAAFITSGTKATVIVTPRDNSLGTKFAISNPRLTATNNVTVNVTNTTSGSESFNSTHFYVTINEF